MDLHQRRQTGPAWEGREQIDGTCLDVELQKFRGSECEAQGDKEEALAPLSRARLKYGVWITGKGGNSGSHGERRTPRPG